MINYTTGDILRADAEARGIAFGIALTCVFDLEVLVVSHRVV